MPSLYAEPKCGRSLGPTKGKFNSCEIVGKIVKRSTHAKTCKQKASLTQDPCSFSIIHFAGSSTRLSSQTERHLTQFGIHFLAAIPSRRCSFQTRRARCRLILSPVLGCKCPMDAFPGLDATIPIDQFLLIVQSPEVGSQGQLKCKALQPNQPGLCLLTCTACSFGSFWADVFGDIVASDGRLAVTFGYFWFAVPLRKKNERV